MDLHSANCPVPSNNGTCLFSHKALMIRKIFSSICCGRDSLHKQSQREREMSYISPSLFLFYETITFAYQCRWIFQSCLSSFAIGLFLVLKIGFGTFHPVVFFLSKKNLTHPLRSADCCFKKPSLCYNSYLVLPHMFSFTACAHPMQFSRDYETIQSTDVSSL